ncbi:hypothetical protein ULMS_03610 [Patiriisocius marinistellae]|uniref:Glycosyl transferase family 1 domain-containing protein n=1 Tax=Patiriisocius marinistellae TaxID=2494560 RepID=A0A5J4FTG4_9FLAO|nr:glycosyltransferase [Patiriisocius marinistellae]GEQ84853.1 hypothetical protein ULMS_03610 [Patiriisocius marinistellae]
MKKKINILLFANIPIESDKRSLGGATILTKEILEYLKNEKSINVKHVQIRKLWKPKLQLFDFIFWLIKFPFIIKKYDIVSLHATKDMHFYFCPLLIIWLRLFKKKYAYHCFAGNFHKQYEQKTFLHKKIIDATILKANALFFETKEMVSYFEKRTKAICIWLPNARKPQNATIRRFEKRFVFISRILPCKGVEEIVEASKNLPKDYIIDLYGPINNDFYPNNYFDSLPINYCGILKPNKVLSTINKYNVMLLPTYCYGEGYPGAIIEALSLGVPTISTHFNSISEIITHKSNGILVPIQDSTALEKAILEFTEYNYKQFAINALKSFDNFNSNLVFSKFTNCYLNV